MAAEQTAERHPSPAHPAVKADRLLRILGTGGREPAGGRKDRPDRAVDSEQDVLRTNSRVPIRVLSFERSYDVAVVGSGTAAPRTAQHSSPIPAMPFPTSRSRIFVEPHHARAITTRRCGRQPACPRAQIARRTRFIRLRSAAPPIRRDTITENRLGAEGNGWARTVTCSLCDRVPRLSNRWISRRESRDGRGITGVPFMPC